ncbi:MAG: chalcone isomerase family protein [Rhodospirillales bacterium]
MHSIRLGLLLAPLLAFAASAAEVDGVVFPDTRQVDGKTLVLNGLGLRTWSFMNIHIYIAGLYLERTTRDPNAIIQSAETKVLTFHFQHDVAADRAREAWRTALTNNCPTPCRLDPEDVERFIAGVPAMRAGDRFELRFADHHADIAANGKSIGRIDGAPLADAMLAAFLGPKPGSPALKQALLDRHG